MSLRAVIEQCFDQCFIRIRREGFYANGVWVETSPSEAPYSGSVQPASQDDIQRLPEGARAEGAIRIHTIVDLRATKPRSGTSPEQIADRVKHNNVLYEVSNVSHWPDYNRAICTKVGQ